MLHYSYNPIPCADDIPLISVWEDKDNLGVYYATTGGVLPDCEYQTDGRGSILGALTALHCDQWSGKLDGLNPAINWEYHIIRTLMDYQYATRTDH